MTLQIESDCKTVVGCVKGVLVSAYCVAVICIVLRIMYRIHWFTQKKWSFELIPLSSTICQSVMQLILNLFVMDTKVLISALYFQTLTFGIISTSCSQLCLRIKYPHKERTAKKYTLIAFSVAQFVSVIIFVLTLVGVFKLDCNDWFSLPYLFPMGVMTCYTFASIAFGSTLISIMKHKLNFHEHVSRSLSLDKDHLGQISPKKHHSQPNPSSPTRRSHGSPTSGQHSDPIGQNIFSEQKQHNEASLNKNINSIGEDSSFNYTNHQSIEEKHQDQMPSKEEHTTSKPPPVVIITEDDEDFNEGGYIAQLKRQLRLIEVLFMATIVLQMGMDCVRTYLLDNCIQCQGSDEFQAQNDYGQLFLIFYQIVQITPCMIAPYVFYYIPYKEDKSGGSILLADSVLSLVLEDDDDEEDDDGDGSRSNNKNNLSKLSIDSKALLQEDFDFSSQVDITNQNKINIKKQQIKKIINLKPANDNLNGNENDKNTSNEDTTSTKKPKRSVSPIQVAEIKNRQRSISSNSNVKTHKISAHKHISKNNNINSEFGTGGSKSNNPGIKIEDRIFEGLKRRKLDDTTEDMGEFIDRMSMNKDDVRKFSSQAGSLILHVPFLTEHNNNNITNNSISSPNKSRNNNNLNVSKNSNNTVGNVIPQEQNILENYPDKQLEKNQNNMNINILEELDNGAQP